MSMISTSPLFSAALRVPPDGGTEKGQQDVDGGSQQSAWQREMERAQMQNWLRHPATEAKAHQQPNMPDVAAPLAAGRAGVAQTVLAHDASTHSAMTVASAAAAQLPSPDTKTQVQMASAAKSAMTAADGHALGQDLLQQLKLNLNLPTLSEAVSEPHLDTVACDPREMVSAGTPGAVAAEETRQLLRIHAHWQGQDMQLWLGVDGQNELLPGQLAQIVRESQSWLASQGARLLSVVCNGQAIYTAPGVSPAVTEKTAAAVLARTQPSRPSFAGHFPYSYIDSQEA
ncbi:hypothetical protein [Collimonas sp.]|jgi:hypothetical protein|uniref:hypothetical protein n=1 Tax=Collimonas sp. TaxID=1963772 RepID=UPI002C34C126|nr:hypothetical protein [Collimonas sp.]HWW08325.1 hypothetical protein [Collimonas sp.]